MLQNNREDARRRLPAAVDPMRQWVGSAGLAVAVGIAYFLAARLSLALLTRPDGVAVFWPASGVAAGVLIALGPGVRVPVAVGAMVGTIAAGLLDPRFGMVVDTLFFALLNAAEALITAGLIERYFGPRFSLNSLRQVLGLLAAAIVGTAISGVGAFQRHVDSGILFHSRSSMMIGARHHARLRQHHHSGTTADPVKLARYPI